MLRKSFLVSGGLSDGKTWLVDDIVKCVRSLREFPCYGFTEHRVIENNTRVGYDLKADLNGQVRTFPFCRLKPRIDISDGMLFDFDAKSVAATLDAFKHASYPKLPSLLFFDEFGRIEARGKGLWEPIKFLISHFERHSIPYAALFTTRLQNIQLFEEKIASDLRWPKASTKRLLLPAKDAEKDAFKEAIVASLRTTK